MKLRALISLVAAAPFALAAHAQTPAAPASEQPTLPTIPPHNCVAPEYPGKQANNEKVKAFNAAYAAYDACVRKYVENLRAWADAAIAKGNEAVAEYNNFNEGLKKQVGSDK